MIEDIVVIQTFVFFLSLWILYMLLGRIAHDAQEANQPITSDELEEAVEEYLKRKQ